MNSLYSLSLLIFSTTLLFGTVKSTTVKECDIQYRGALPEVDIENCNESPCTFKVNSTQLITLKFTSPGDYEHIVPKAVAIVEGDMLFRYDVNQEDACEGITNTQCPLKEGESVEYNLNMLFGFPTIRSYGFAWEFVLLDQDNGGEAFECFKIDIIFED